MLVECLVTKKPCRWSGASRWPGPLGSEPCTPKCRRASLAGSTVRALSCAAAGTVRCAQCSAGDRGEPHRQVSPEPAPRASSTADARLHALVIKQKQTIKAKRQQQTPCPGKCDSFVAFCESSQETGEPDGGLGDPRTPQVVSGVRVVLGLCNSAPTRWPDISTECHHRLWLNCRNLLTPNSEPNRMSSSCGHSDSGYQGLEMDTTLQ